MAKSHFMLSFLHMKHIKRIKLDEINKLEVSTHISKNSTVFDDERYNQCRICLLGGNIPIYNDETLLESIKLFGGFSISVNEYVLPNHICETCNSLLKAAILFRKTAQESNKILLLRSKEIVQKSEVKYNLNRLSSHESNHQSKRKSQNPEYSDLSENESPGSVDQTNRQNLNCKLCKLSFHSPHELTAHKNSKKHRNILLKCPKCKHLLRAYSYRKHLKRHNNETLSICEICGKQFRKDNLIRHMQLHSLELPFRCTVCPYRGRFEIALQIHMRKHTGERPYPCDKCQQRFLTKSNLNRHAWTHKKDRPFKCIECGRGYYSKHDVDEHFKADHAGIRDITCLICGSKFGTRKSLRRHELKVHKREKMEKGRVPTYLKTGCEN